MCVFFCCFGFLAARSELVCEREEQSGPFAGDKRQIFVLFFSRLSPGLAICERGVKKDCFQGVRVRFRPRPINLLLLLPLVGLFFTDADDGASRATQPKTAKTKTTKTTTKQKQQHGEIDSFSKLRMQEHKHSRCKNTNNRGCKNTNACWCKKTNPCGCKNTNNGSEPKHKRKSTTLKEDHVLTPIGFGLDAVLQAAVARTFQDVPGRARTCQAIIRCDRPEQHIK